MYHDDGMTQSEIADEFDVSATTVGRWMDHYGVEARADAARDYDDRPWDDGALLRAMYHDDGMTQSEIADEFGCSVSTITRAMERNGVEARGLSDAVSAGRSEEPWHDAELLERMYHGRSMTLQEIGDELGCSPGTVGRWMEKNGVDRRDPLDLERRKPATFTHHQDGYEVWTTWVEDRGRSAEVRVHRLVAVAEHGVQAVKDRVVHHKNGIPWDNRPSNLTVEDTHRHRRIHSLDHKKRKCPECGCEF